MEEQQEADTLNITSDGVNVQVLHRKKHNNEESTPMIVSLQTYIPSWQKPGTTFEKQ